MSEKPEENLKDRAYAKKTLRYIATYPLHFLRNYAIKLGNFLIYPRPGHLPAGERSWLFRGVPILQDGLLALGLLGMAGLFATRRDGGPATAVIVLIVYLIAMGALMHLTLDGRMNLPLRALLALPAGYAISRLLARLGLGEEAGNGYASPSGEDERVRPQSLV